MLAIQLNDGVLDIYTQDIDWTWETIRFSEGIRDQFSTDIEIPKTENNMHLLDVAGLLDSMTQPLGTQIAPCVMNMGDNVMDVYLQVVSVREEDITICVFEKTLPNNILDTNIGKYVVDDDNSIFVWNVNTRPAYPNDFKTYWYGMAYNPNYAQLHPSKDLNEVIQRVNAGAGINMPLSPSTKYVVATKKTVCPQNKIQVIEGHWTDDSGNFAVLSGGQHITNDCEFSYSPDSTTITFNRKCKVTGKIYCSYKKKDSVTNSFPLYICRYNQGEPVFAPSYNIPSNNYASFVTVDSYQAQMKQGSELRVQCNNTNKYDMLNFVLVLTITDYTITENDYGEELKYVGRTPRLIVWSDDGQFKFGSNAWQDMVDGNGGGYTYCWFDGTTYATHYHQTGHSTQHLTEAFTLEWCSIAYFGYWCNIPDIKVKELMWGLCWTDGKKLVNTTIHNMWMLNKVLHYEDANETAVIEGWISETRISSDRLGKDNYILSSGQNTEQSAPISHIDNQWLENSKKIHESPFSYALWRYGYWYCIDQYSEPEHDTDSEEYKCKFNDVDGFAVADAGTVQTLLYRLNFNPMGFENMTQSVEVDIHTMNDVKNLDFVFLDGRKYMIIEGSTDLKTGESTLTALLVPYNQQQLEPDHDYPQEDENHWEDDHEPSYPDDPNDDFNPDDDHSEYDDPDDHDPNWKLAKKEVTSITCRTDQYGNTGVADETRTATYIDTNQYSDSYKKTKTVDETVEVFDPKSCPIDTSPSWESQGETMTGYECITNEYGNTGECRKTYTTTYVDMNPRSKSYGATRTETRTETVTDTTLCPESPAHDYFTITNVSNGNIRVSMTDEINGYDFRMNYSLDDGNTWTNGSSVTLANGQSVKMRHTGAFGRRSNSTIYSVHFNVNGNYEISGNIASLTHGDNFFTGSQLTMPDYAFTNLFYNNSYLVSAKNLYFGFTTISDYGCRNMFYNCLNLKEGISLANIVQINSYGCESMFYNCSKLETNPNLTSLIVISSAGALGMFEGCNKIRTADLSYLSSTNTGCCQNMFQNCNMLNKVYIQNLNSWNTNQFRDWLDNVASHGTLYVNSSIINSIPSNDASGCPSGWSKTAI